MTPGARPPRPRPPARPVPGCPPRCHPIPRTQPRRRPRTGSAIPHRRPSLRAPPAGASPPRDAGRPPLRPPVEAAAPDGWSPGPDRSARVVPTARTAPRIPQSSGPPRFPNGGRRPGAPTCSQTPPNPGSAGAPHRDTQAPTTKTQQPESQPATRRLPEWVPPNSRLNDQFELGPRAGTTPPRDSPSTTTARPGPRAGARLPRRPRTQQPAPR